MHFAPREIRPARESPQPAPTATGGQGLRAGRSPPSGGGAVVEVEADLNPRVDVYPVETLERLVTDFRRYHPIEADHATLDLDADSPTYAADFRDIKGYVSGQECQLGVPLS